MGLFSEVPLHEVDKILLDYQSRTSVELLKILIKDYWKITPVLQETTGEYQSQISGSTAALIIGDRALEQRTKSTFIYDLGFEWKIFKNLPFVFAAWVSNKKLDKSFITSFNEATSSGLSFIDKIVNENPFPAFSLKDYFTKYISYKLDENKLKSMDVFADMIRR